MVSTVNSASSFNNLFFQPNIGIQVALRALPGVDFVSNFIQQLHFTNRFLETESLNEQKNSLKNLMFTQKVQAACSAIKLISVIALAILFPPVAGSAVAIATSVFCSLYATSILHNCLALNHNTNALKQLQNYSDKLNEHISDPLRLRAIAMFEQPKIEVKTAFF